ncbi:MAG: hypothetical protein ACM3WS_02935, partial [Bacillota bacterium]
MAQSKGTKKSDRHHHSERSSHKAKSRHEEHSPDMRPDDGAHGNASPAMLALPDNSQDDHRAQADQTAMPLALVPQRMEAAPAVDRKCRLPNSVQAILISVCLTVALILTLGMLKGNRNA